MVKERPTYYHAPDPEALGITPERHIFLMGTVIQQFFLNPSISFSTECWGDFIYNLRHRSDEAREAGYDDMDILYSIEAVQQLVTSFGLIQGKEIDAIRNGHRLEKPDFSSKYLSWERLVELSEVWKQNNLTVGLVHGSFDPVHVGHARLITKTQSLSPQKIDIMLVGLDSDKILKQRKGEDRPRFPLGSRLWELASLGTVDGVFVLPMQSVSSQEFYNFYKTLNIKVLGVGGDNPLIPEYKKRMDEIGGHLVENSNAFFSSTRMIKSISNSEIEKQTLLNLSYALQQAKELDEKAKKAGFLYDYPSKT